MYRHDTWVKWQDYDTLNRSTNGIVQRRLTALPTRGNALPGFRTWHTHSTIAHQKRGPCKFTVQAALLDYEVQSRLQYSRFESLERSIDQSTDRGAANLHSLPSHQHVGQPTTYPPHRTQAAAETCCARSVRHWLTPTHRSVGL